MIFLKFGSHLPVATALQELNLQQHCCGEKIRSRGFGECSQWSSENQTQDITNAEVVGYCTGRFESLPPSHIAPRLLLSVLFNYDVRRSNYVASVVGQYR
jgi:hypothetical protein